MTRAKVPVVEAPKAHIRFVFTSSPWEQRFWFFVAVPFALALIGNVVGRDWGDALDGMSILVLLGFLVSRNRDVNALLGGHRPTARGDQR